MNTREKGVLEIFGQRLDDHIRVCGDAHLRIESTVKELRVEASQAIEAIRLSVGQIKSNQSESKGGYKVGTWLISTSIAVGAATIALAGLVASIIIQIMS